MEALGRSLSSLLSIKRALGWIYGRRADVERVKWGGLLASDRIRGPGWEFLVPKDADPNFEQARKQKWMCSLDFGNARDQTSILLSDVISTVQNSLLIRRTKRPPTPPFRTPFYVFSCCNG